MIVNTYLKHSTGNFGAEASDETLQQEGIYFPNATGWYNYITIKPLIKSVWYIGDVNKGVSVSIHNLNPYSTYKDFPSGIVITFTQDSLC